MYVFDCLLASMFFLHVCLSKPRPCHALCPLWVCACRSLGLLAYVVASTPLVVCWMWPLVRHTSVVLVFLMHTLSLLRAMLLCLPCLLCATRLAFFASLHFCTLAYMFIHEFMCRTCSNLMELWTPDPNLHLFS